MDVRRAPAPSAALQGALQDKQSGTLVAAAQLAIIYAGSTLLTPLYQLYRFKFGFSQLTLTAIYAAYLVGNLIGLLFFARLSDQVGRRLVNLAALSCAILATLLFISAASVAWLFAGRIVSGLAVSLAATAATAWVSEFTPDQQRASAFTTAGNSLGLGIGALLAGLLAEYAPKPLTLSFIAYLALLGIMALLVGHSPETVRNRKHSARQLSLAPRLGVPRELLGAFVAPAAAGFASFAVIGYYGALIPGLLAQSLDEPGPAIAGGVVTLLAVLGATTAILARGLSSRTAMLAGGALLLPALVLLPCAQIWHSMTLLLIGTVVAGPATLLGYRGSLQVVNELAPGGRRAEMIASYILVAYCANALPILGVGVLSRFTSPLTADIAFAVIIAILAALALVIGARRLPKAGAAPQGANK
jgi:predicted MFS family arabinose efflux permease